MTISGRAVALVAAGIIPVLLIPSWVTVASWLVVIGVILGADLLISAPVRDLTVHREEIKPLRFNQDTTSVVVVRNSSRRVLRALIRDAWPPSAGTGTNRHRIRVAPDQVRRLETTLKPTRRGDIEAAGVTVRSHGPLGLAARQRTLTAPADVRVLPEFASRRHLPSRLARRREMDGRTSVNVRGQGTEFDSLREYVIGDDVRSIDWRATARRAEVVVRTWRPERDRRVLIVLDTSRLSAARLGDVPRLEAGIESALLLTALASKAGDRVDLVAVDRTVRVRTSGQSGPALMSTLADSLSGVQPQFTEPDWTVVATEISQRLSQRALVVIITGLEPGAVESGLLPLVSRVARDHLVMLASAEDPSAAQMRAARDTSADLFGAAAAHRAELERGALATRLSRSGAHVVRREPDTLPPGVADTYLGLKAAGLL